MKLNTSAWLAALILMVAFSPVVSGSRVKDLTQVEGARDNQLTGYGIVVGLAGALALTRVLSSLLYAVTPTDPLTLATVSAMLIAIALLASYIPARRAARIDPMEALRCE